MRNGVARWDTVPFFADTARGPIQPETALPALLLAGWGLGRAAGGNGLSSGP
ncbi:MAG: hypothetical protein MR459_20650 [Enterocloster aldenensis]|nr:hypothetical protein [uncultured Lachnoclostridium sp.]MCI5490375.1 hypothetical protein [Enterocloster aldenensis]MDY4533071.1 hypothetical protein [Enterocloster aldenensis]